MSANRHKPVCVRAYMQENTHESGSSMKWGGQERLDYTPVFRHGSEPWEADPDKSQTVRLRGRISYTPAHGMRCSLCGKTALVGSVR